MFNTSEVLKQKKHEIAFFSMHHHSNLDSIWSKYFISNVDFNKNSGVIGKIKLFFHTLYSKEAEKNLEEVISDFKPDIAHVHNFNHQLTPSILNALNKSNIPVVITLHDLKLVCPNYSMLNHGNICELCKGKKFYHCIMTRCHKNSFSKSFLAALESYLHHYILGSYKKVKALIGPSMFLINKYKEMGLEGQYVHLPNFIDTSKFLPRFGSKSKAIVYCGKLSPEKGIRTLIKAVKDLPVELRVLGEGILRNELEVIMPSELYENNPYSVLEAFALGKPVIGSRIGGIPELVRDGVTGMIYKAGNVDDLKDKIEYMYLNKDKVFEMGKNARRVVEEEFNSKKYYEKLLEIYQKAIKEN
jgi:glycosyltransferase involved in cell wall biosynthesis